MTQNYANLTAVDFESAVAVKLPPRGLAWSRLAGSVFQNFWRVIADALAAVHARAAVLTEYESFPPTSIELLPDWERVLGLPDPCLGANPVTSARQAAIKARLASSGGQSIPYFEAAAAALGAEITVTEYAPWRWGVDPLWGAMTNPGSAYVWLVTLEDAAVFDFEWGISAVWEPYWQVANNPIICELQRLRPAHTQVNFAISPTVPSGGVFLTDFSLTDSGSVLT